MSMDRNNNQITDTPTESREQTQMAKHHGDPVMCRNPLCRQEIGRLYRIGDDLFGDDLFLLQAGSLIIREGHSMFCVHCGQGVHFSLSDQRLEKVLKRKTG
jgi:hypothetical protein